MSQIWIFKRWKLYVTVVALSAIYLISIILTMPTIRAKDLKKLNLTSAVKKNVNNTEQNKTGLRPFVFLTQTEQCLRRKQIENLKLNSSKECRCDVIVVSYKTQCKEEKPPHVTYVFDNTTTWTTGRNMLFFHAMDRKPGYIYYIFMDDDIFLTFNEAATPEMRQHTPIQIFQNWLLDYEPAVGVVEFHETDGRTAIRKAMLTICGSFDKTSLTNPTVMYDMLFNAFHANAVRHIFPLDTRHEASSWWLSGRYVQTVVELKFRGQALLFFPITAHNPMHRPYPHGLPSQEIIWREFIENVQREAPAQYANHSLFEEYKKNPMHYIQTARTLCMNVTRHQPISPFAHFAGENNANIHSNKLGGVL